MPPAHRKGDICTGHGCYPPRPSSEGSPDTFVNGLNYIRVGDPYVEHCCSSDCHPGALDEGSPDVFVNGISAGRLADFIDCGSAAAQGSQDTFLN